MPVDYTTTQLNEQKLTCTRCGRKTASLYHVKGDDGRYCSSCKPPSPPPQRSQFEEDVRGVIVGDMLTNYQFWTTDNQNCIARTSQEDAASATAWFHANYPEAWAAGALMRIYED